MLLLEDAATRCWSVHLTLALLANAQNWLFDPGCAGVLLGIESVNTTAVTTAAKLATLTVAVSVGGTPTASTTGGVLALTSANQTPIAARVAGTAIASANTFARGDLIGFQVSGVTAFVEGLVTVTVRYKQSPLAN